MYTPTATEHTILSSLWASEEGLTAAELYQLSSETFSSRTALHPILNQMIKKGMVTVSGMKPTARAYARVFQAAISPEQYSIAQVKQNTSFLQDSKQKLSNISVALLGAGGVKPDTLEKIQALLRQEEDEV